MKKNVNGMDRNIRLIVAAVLIGLYMAGILTGTVGLVALVIAGVMAVTAIFSFCPMYTILGMCKSCCSSNDAASNDPHKSGGCCGHCGSEDEDKK